MSGFGFEIGDRVRIKEMPDITGTVRQLLKCYTGLQAEVRYFDKGDAKSVWFYLNEIEKH